MRYKYLTLYVDFKLRSMPITSPLPIVGLYTTRTTINISNRKKHFGCCVHRHHNASL